MRREEWLIRETGSYLPDTHEVIVDVVSGQVLSDKQALRLRALRDFTDKYGEKRKAGQEWLITNKQAQVHIKDVFEEVVSLESAQTLSSRQYCVIVNPFDEKSQQNKWGAKVLVKGEKMFFLKPGE